MLAAAFGLRQLLCIAGAQHHIRVGPVLRIEERKAPDRDLGIGLGNLAELRADVAFARIQVNGFREHANAGLEIGRRLVKHRLHDRGHARHPITLPIQKPGVPDTLLRMRSAPLGIRVMRRRASFISAPVVSCRMARARGSVSIVTPNAMATQAAVISLRVDPPPGHVRDTA